VREPIVAQTVESTEKNMEEIRYIKERSMKRGKKNPLTKTLEK